MYRCIDVLYKRERRENLDLELLEKLGKIQFFGGEIGGDYSS